MNCFVPGYVHDVFVSYAHVDNEPFMPADPESQWVSACVKHVKGLLARRLGRGDLAKIWRDDALRRHEGVTPEIAQAVGSAATLLLVLSEGYLNSEWCQRELELFIASHGGVAKATSRIFVVALEEIPQDRRPEALRDLIGYRFYERDRQGQARILGWPRPLPDEREYYHRLDDLSRDLAAKLRDLAAEATATTTTTPAPVTGPLPPAAPTAASSAPAAPDIPARTVFLAEVTDDMDGHRDDVKRYLEQAGIGVYPKAWYKRSPTEFAQQMRDDLPRCSTFVQLLGPRGFRRSPDLANGYDGLQYELAKGAGLRLRRWRDPSLDLGKVTDAQHAAALNGPDVVAESIESYKASLVQDLLRPPPPPPTQDKPKFVFVGTHDLDLPLAKKVTQMIDESAHLAELGYEVSDQIHVEELTETPGCQGLILLYGECPPDWVRDQLRQCRKYLARAREKIEAYGICSAPPARKDELLFKIPGMREVVYSDTSEFKSALEAFFRRTAKA